MNISVFRSLSYLTINAANAVIFLYPYARPARRRRLAPLFDVLITAALLLPIFRLGVQYFHKLLACDSLALVKELRELVELVSVF